MKLVIGQSIDNNRVRLDFRKSPDRPDNIPSYEIENSKADEFVRKYNIQSDKIKKISNTIIGAGTLGGTLAGIKIYRTAASHKLIKSISAACAGLLSGTLISAITASKMKNKLMDKYDVRVFTTQE